jgi:hypothetical protein
MPLDDTNWSTQTEVDAATALLVRARGFIERGWCRGALARDMTGIATNPISSGAVAWCPNGALIAARMPNHFKHTVRGRLTAATGGYSITGFNDEQTTVEPILAAFDRAIAAYLGGDISVPAGHAIAAGS